MYFRLDRSHAGELKQHSEIIVTTTIAKRNNAASAVACRRTRLRRDLLLVLVLGLLSTLPGLGLCPPLNPTDSFFLESGREMLETGQYLLPLNNYQPWLDKPILFFWMVCGSYKVFGITTFAGRLPAALSVVATGVIILFGTRRLISPRASLLAALIFMSLPLVSIVGHVCLTDVTLTGLVTGCILALWRSVARRPRITLMLGYLSLALGVLCKGPIAVILSVLALFPSLRIARGNLKQVFVDSWRMGVPLGLLLTVLLSLPWYLAASSVTDGEFFRKFFFEQNFGRMAGTVNHQMPFWFYIPVFIFGYLPFSPLTFCAPKTIIRAFKKPTVTGTRGMLLLSTVWLVLVTGLFCCIKTKLPTYILPAAPALAILVAVQIDLLLRKGRQELLWVPVGVTLAACSAAPFVNHIFNRFGFSLLPEHALVYGTTMLLAASSAWALWKRKAEASLLVLLMTLFFTYGMIVPEVMKGFYQKRMSGFDALVVQAKGDNNEVAILMSEMPTMPYILHHPVHRLQSPEQVHAFIEAPADKHYVLIADEMLKRLDWFAGLDMKRVGRSGKWSLMQF